MSFLAAPPVAAEPKIDPTVMHLTATWKHTSPAIAARFDPSGRYLFSTAQDNKVLRWDMATGKNTEFIGHKSWVRGLTFAAGRLFTADWAGRITAWPIEGNAEPIWTIQAHRGWARAVTISPDGNMLASCGNDHLVKLWSPVDGSLLRTFAEHDCHAYNVAFHPQGKSLVSADLKGIVKVWDLDKNQMVRQLDAKQLYKYDAGFRADIGGVRSMAFDAEGKYLACAGITNVTNAFAGVGNPLVLLFDWVSGALKLELKPKAAFQGTAWGVVFHRRGWVLGVGGGNGGVFWAWKLDSGVPFHTLTLPNNARDLALHPDGRRLAIPCADGLIRLYDLAEKKKA